MTPTHDRVPSPSRSRADAAMAWLLERTLSLIVWGWERTRPLLGMGSGHANPRVAHISGAFGYYIHGHRLTMPNIRRWMRGERHLFPTVLQVQTVNRCNAACPMCPYPYTIALEPQRAMDDALFSKIAAECASESDFMAFVPMSMNEPLLDTKLERRIHEFKRQAQPHQIVELVTNGSGLTRIRFGRLVASGVDLLTVSMSAATPAIYEQVMAGLKWDQVVRNLEAITNEDVSSVRVFLRYIKQQANL